MKYCLIEGYLCIDKPSIVSYLHDCFNQEGKEIIMTFNSPWVIDRQFDLLKNISDSSSILFFNEKEAEAFAKNTKIDYYGTNSHENVLITTYISL